MSLMTVAASPSVHDLDRCAARHLAHYVDPLSGRDFHAYDRVGDPDRIEPTDLPAPALLDAPSRGREVIAMFGRQEDWSALLDALRDVVADEAASTARIEDVDLDDEGGPWRLVKRALAASHSTPGVKGIEGHEILHRKRPLLVPIFDRLITEFYGVSTRKPWDFWPIPRRRCESIARGSRTSPRVVVPPTTG